ncbi:MAG TPA: LiaF domain-containing protein [Actinomycetota bacterium]|nr:LiaF domain-containing protein [Actinomycetota bacterium]
MSEPAAPPPERARGSLAGIAFGALLILAGGAWLLHTLDVVEVSVEVVVPAALIVLGILLLAAARRGRQGGLITLGVILTVLSALVASTDLTGGVGDRRVALSGTEPVRDQELGIGQLVVDLSDLAPRGPVSLSAEVSIGELRVDLPPNLPVRVEATSGIGQVDVFEEADGGFGSELDHVDDGFEGAAASLDLQLSVGIGQVTVTR